jgi:hypothetical protein
MPAVVAAGKSTKSAAGLEAHRKIDLGSKPE